MIFSSDALSSVPFSAVPDLSSSTTSPAKVLRLLAAYAIAARLAAFDASTVRLRCAYEPARRQPASVRGPVELVCQYETVIDLEASLNGP